jgi:hypothetical protein
VSAPDGSGAASFVERALDRLARLTLRVQWTANGRIVVQGVFGFLMQVVRSRALGLRQK